MTTKHGMSKLLAETSGFTSMAWNLYSLLTILGFPENTHMPVNSQAEILWNSLLNLEITEALQSHLKNKNP